MPSLMTLGVFGLFLFTLFPSSAQSQADPGPITRDGTVRQGPTVTLDGAVVVEDGKPKEKAVFKIGSRLDVVVSNTTDVASGEKPPVLIVDGIAVDGLVRSIRRGDDETRFRFTVEIDDASRAPLRRLFGRLHKAERTVEIALAPPKGKVVVVVDGSPARGTVALPATRTYAWWMAGILAVVVGGFLYASSKSRFLREGGFDPASDKKRAFSLAKVQLAWWFFIVFGSATYVYVVTGMHDVVTGTAIVLLGLATITTAGAKVVDGKKETEERTDAERQIADARNRGDTDETTRLENVRDDRERAPESRGFLKDLFTNADGAGLHRFQMIVWTLALGIVFVYEVWKHLAMPTFSETLLGLMGIGSATYVGFKIPEKPKPA